MARAVDQATHQGQPFQNGEQRVDATFDAAVVAADLREVRDVYARQFAIMDASRWDAPSKRGRAEWTLHEALGHLCALNGAGLESIKHTLRGEPYVFRGLEDRYLFNQWNRSGIDAHLDLKAGALCSEFLHIHDEAADIAADLSRERAAITADMPIYNRPVQLIEALSIMIMHAGLIHAAQVTEPSGSPPLWTQFSPEFRHRLVGRVMRAFSLLYRRDIGGSLRAVIAFRTEGSGGGEWYVDLSPESATSGEGVVQSPALRVRFRDPDDFCRMMTGRLRLMPALIAGRMRPRGDLRLFLRMNKLFSVDARP